MDEDCRALSDSLNSVSSAQLMSMVQRLKEEHGVLKEKVTVLYSKAVEFNENPDTGNWKLLPPLRTEAQLLMKELDEHDEWEEKELYPTITEYFNLNIGPTITPSIWVLKKEYGQAKRLIRPFLDVCVKIFFEENPEILYNSQTIAQIKLAVADLLQACLILQEHFEMEENLIKQSYLRA